MHFVLKVDPDEPMNQSLGGKENRIEQRLSSFENTFPVSAHRFYKPHDHDNKQARLNGIGVHVKLVKPNRAATGSSGCFGITTF